MLFLPNLRYDKRHALVSKKIFQTQNYTNHTHAINLFKPYIRKRAIEARLCVK